MPTSNFLTQEQRKSLQKAIKEDECPHFRERVLIMLLANDGKTQQEIAEFIGCSLRTVNHWFTHSDPNDLDSFRDRRGNGNHTKITTEYINLLMKVVEQEPTELGYEFGRWTAQRLAEHLAKETNIVLSNRQVNRILKKSSIAISGKSTL